MEGRKAPRIERQDLECSSQSLPPVRGCVRLWRRGQQPGTLRRQRAVYGLCACLECRGSLRPTRLVEAKMSRF